MTNICTTNTCTKVLALLYLTLLKVLFAPIGLRTHFRPWFAGVNLGNVRLSPTAEIALFRVTQEALTNVRRHAHTTRTHVSLERQDKTVRLRVRDQGQGFQLAELESESGPGERVGLSSMRERVALLGGNFEVRSQSGTGTSITVEIPLIRRAES